MESFAETKFDLIFLSSKKEYKEGSCPLSLAQRKELKETSTYSKSLPIWRDLNSGLQKPTNLRMFW